MVEPLTARPEVIRQLLVLSIGLGSLGTFAGGILSIDRIGPDAPSFFAVAHRYVAPEAEVALLAAETGPAELADVGDTVSVVVTEPVTALINSTAPTGKIASVDVEQVAADASSTVSSIAATTTTAPAPTTTTTTTLAVEPTATTEVTTTTAAPAAPPTTATPAPTTATTVIRTYTADEVRAIIAEVFGPTHTQGAVKVATCESGLNPRAISKGGGNWGLFQINRVHQQRVAKMGYAWDDLLDPRVNSIVAKAIFDGSGWGPWACNP